MSEFCIAVLSGVDSELRAPCRNGIEMLAKELGVGVQFTYDGIYYEPALEGYWNFDEFLIFNISDDEQTRNCENLLCADWCNLHDAYKRPPLRVRLNLIASLLSEALHYGQRINLFIGASGDEASDLTTINCNITELCDRLIREYEREGATPGVQLILTQSKANENAYLY